MSSKTTESKPARRRSRWPAVVWLVAFAIAGAGTAYMMLKSHEAKQVASPERARKAGIPIPVRTVSVVETKADKVIGATCVTLPSQEVAIRSSATRGLHLSQEGSIARPGVALKAVHVREGQRVKRGELLFELESDDDQLVFEQWKSSVSTATEKIKLIEQTAGANAQAAESELASANENLKFRKTDLETKTKLHDAMSQLFKRQSASAAEYYAAQASQADAEYQLKEAELRVRQATDEIALGKVRDALAKVEAVAERSAAEFAMKLSERDVARCRIESPLDGFVGKMMVMPGQLVDSTTTLTQVLKLDPIHVQMDYPQERIDEVTVGQTGEIVLDSHPNETLYGTVVAISPQVTTDTRVLSVTLEVANPGSRIKAGISGFVRLSVATAAKALPPTAIIQQGTRATVFRVDGGKARITSVKVGPMISERLIAIESGLEVGDEIVLFGQDALEDGDAVNPDWKTWSGRMAEATHK